jgi:hypothetical protein
MPHKRAKRAVREKLRDQKFVSRLSYSNYTLTTTRGTDRAPAKQSLSSEAVPKSLSRVLNASKIREEWKTKKRKLQEDGDIKRAERKRRKLGDVEVGYSQSTKGKAKVEQTTSRWKIKPGEPIQHFNRFVGQDSVKRIT